MRKDLFRTGLLSLTASALVVSNVEAMNVVQSASLDLKTYSMVKVVFDDLNDSGINAFKQDVADGNITIENNTTDDNVSLAYAFERNVTNADGNVTLRYEMYLSIPDGNDTNIIKGNTYNQLVLHFNDVDLNDSNNSRDFNLTFTLADRMPEVNLSVTDNAWNLITLPAGTMTNARELIKANKVTMVWGWDWNGSVYNWEDYPSKMVPGRGYWVRTRVESNTEGNLNDIILSDYNTTVVGDYNTSVDINESNFSAITSKVPQPEQWVLLGNSTGKRCQYHCH